MWEAREAQVEEVQSRPDQRSLVGNPYTRARPLLTRMNQDSASTPPPRGLPAPNFGVERRRKPLPWDW